MKKIWIASILVPALLCAENITDTSIDSESVESQSLESLLESKKVKKSKSTSWMPDISLIVDASYTHQSWDEEGHTDHLELPGLIHGGGHDHEEHAHTPLSGNDGFNLNYAELTIGASVDKYFDLKGVFHLTEDDFEIEEAFATTSSLPYHLRLKLGKFKSDFGYLNNKHHHNYNFSEMPLIYSALLGDHGLTEQGFQLQYVLPTSQYVMVGLEALKGENERTFGHEGFTIGADAHEHEEEGHGESLTSIDDSDFPGILVAYMKTSFDIGDGTWLAGVSMAKGDFRLNHQEDENPHTFHGTSTLYGVDMTYKHYFAADHAITWQSEYLFREMDGTKYVENAVSGEWMGSSLKKEQSGFYTELIYQYDKNYRAGLRYSAISQNEITANVNVKENPEDMYVASAMLEYNPTEFSRIRLQYNHDSSLYDEEGHKNNKNEIVVQFNYAIGAHGAHAF